MPKLEVTNAELEIISHALELFLDRYKKARDHWRWFAQRYPLIGARITLQGIYDGLEDTHQAFISTAKPLVVRIDNLLKEASFSPEVTPRSQPVKGGIHDRPVIAEFPKARGKRANTEKLRKK